MCVCVCVCVWRERERGAGEDLINPLCVSEAPVDKLFVSSIARKPEPQRVKVLPLPKRRQWDVPPAGDFHSERRQRRR